MHNTRTYRYVWHQRGIYHCLYVYVVCNRTVMTYSRVWINRVRFPILLVVSWTGKMNIPLSPYVPENFVSRDGFGSSAPRPPAHLHTQAESGAFLQDSSRFPRRRPFIYLTGPLVWDTRFSLLDWVRVAGLSCTRGVWYIYDWDTG